MNNREQLLEKIKNVPSIVRYGDFTLKHGDKTNIYINLRELLMHPSLLYEVINLLFKRYKYFSAKKDDLFAGVEYISGCGGFADVLASNLAVLLNLKLIVFREVPKKRHGLLDEELVAVGDLEKGANETQVANGKKVLVVEDTITTGKTLESHTKKLQQYGLNNIVYLGVVARMSKSQLLSSSHISHLPGQVLYFIEDFVVHDVLGAPARA